MADVALAIQKSIVAALAGMTAPSESGGAPVAVAVYDHPPDDAAFPHVTLSGQSIAATDVLDADYAEHAVYLSVWSRYRGQRQVLAVMAAVRDRLHHADLVLEAGDSLVCRVTSQLASREPDGITYQGAMTITVTAGY